MEFLVIFNLFSLVSVRELVIFSSETEVYLSLQMLGMVLRNVSRDYSSECRDCTIVQRNFAKRLH